MKKKPSPSQVSASKTVPPQTPTLEQYIASRRRRNLGIFGGIVLLCVIFYLITIIRLGGAG